MSINRSEKTLSPETMMADPGRWLRFLPRWSLMVGLAALALPFVFIGGLGQQTADNALGAEYVELLQAVRSPLMFRLS